MKKLSWSAVKKDFNFNSVTEVYFWKSEWETFDPHDHDAPISWFYFAYRFLYMGWFVGSTITIFECGRDYNNGFFFIFLTNQTFILQVIYSIVYFLYMLWVVWRKYGRRRTASDKTSNFHDEKYRLPIPSKLIWIILNVLLVVPFIVTVGYWALLYDSSEERSTCSTLNNILVHGINSPMVLLEMSVIAIPVRYTHAIFPILAGVWYGVFSGFYELFNGEYSGDKDYIYPMLDWKNKPGFAVLSVFVALIAVIVIHALMKNLYRLRVHIKSKFVKNTS